MKSSKLKVPDSSGLNEEYRKVQESMKELGKKLHEAMRPVEESIRRAREAIAPVYAEHMRKISEAMTPIAEFIRELPDNTKRVLKKLAEKGWFLSLDSTIPEVAHLAKLIESNDDAGINRFLVGFYTEQLDEVLNSLIATFPGRAHLFRSAFKAHNRKEYDLTIPVLLAQADGVCYDMLGVYLFSQEKKLPKTKEALERKIGSPPLVSICDAFLEPLRSGSALMLNNSQSKEKRRSTPGYNVLNRHEILHGIDKNYGNELNSLRAIAQLDYLRSIQELLRNREEWKEQFPAPRKS